MQLLVERKKEKKEWNTPLINNLSIRKTFGTGNGKPENLSAEDGPSSNW